MTGITRMNTTAQPRQHGLSLIELMIALALSMLLILGLIEIFGSTRAAFAASEGLARTQENSRFAMDFVRRDARMAGHMGCLNEFGHIRVGPNPITGVLEVLTDGSYYNHMVVDGASIDTAPYAMRSELPVQVYEFTGSIPGSAYTIASSAPATAGSGAGWTPALPAALDLVSAGAGGIIDGSDVLVVRYFDEAPMTLVRFGAGRADAGLNQVTGDVYLGAKAASITPFAVYGLSNCRAVSLFQVNTVDAVAGTVNTENAGNQVIVASGDFWNAKENYGIGSMMFRYRAVAYYIGRGANGGPSLFRKAISDTPVDVAAGLAFATPAEEVVEGVELMQILLATAGATTVNGRVDDSSAYQSTTALLTGVATEAERIAALRRISGLRVSLLMRSPSPGVGINPTSATVVVGDVIVTPPLDQRLRHVYESLIMLRNRQRA